MRVFTRRLLLIFVLLFLASCGASPETKKARHFEQGDKFFAQKQYREAAIEYANVIQIDGNNKAAHKKLAQVFATIGDPGRELPLMLKLRGIDLEDFEVRLRLARLQLLFDRPREAREEIEFVLEREPGNMEALSLLAESSRTQEQVADAIARLLETSPSPQDKPRHNLALAQLYLKKGDLQKAENSFLESLSGDANFVEAHLGLGDLAAIKKDYRQAEQEYKAAADLVPGVSMVQLKLADFYLFRRDPAKARSVLENALEKAPDFAPAQNRLARIALGEKKIDESWELTEKILQRNPTDLEARITRAQLFLAKSEPAEAEKSLMEITAAHPELPFPKYLLGLALLAKGDLANASASFKDAVDRDPSFTEAALRLAELYNRTGSYQAANDLLYKVLDRDSGNLEAIFLLSDAARTGREITTAIRRLEQVRFHFKDNARFNLSLAALYLKNNDLKKAEELLKSILASEPNSAETHTLMAQLMLRKKDLGHGEQELKRAVELSPENSVARVMLAEFYFNNQRGAEAKAVLKEMLEKSPEFFPASFSLARMAFEERNYTEATALLDTVVRQNPTHLDAQLLRAQAKLALNSAAEALQDLQQILNVNPGLFQAQYLSGLAYLQMGDAARAKPFFVEATRIQPDFPDSRLRLAEIDLATGAYPAAISNLEFLQEKGSKIPSLNLLLGSAYLAGNDAKKARALFQKYTEANPSDPQGRHLLCLSTNALGNKAEAAKCFEDVLKAFPDFLDPLAQLVAIDLSANNTDSALKRINKLLESPQPKPELYQMLGRVHSIRKDYDAAEKAYLKAIEMSPDTIAYQLDLIQAYMVSKKNGPAISRLQDTLRRDPKNVATLMLAGMIYQQENDIPKARDAYERAVAIKPDLVLAANNLAYLLCEHFGDTERALRLARAAKEGAPADPSIADTLGWILYRQGNFAWALDYIKEGAAKLPDNPEIQFHLGMVQYQMGNAEEAKKALGRALELKPDFKGADEARKTLAEIQ